MKKRGALELSINTIVVVVIGITLLTLGLVFVKGIFGKLNTLGSDVFQKANIEINKIAEGDTKFNIPSAIIIEQGDAKTVSVVVGNDGSKADGTTFTLSLTRKSCATCPTEQQVRAEILDAPPSIKLNKGQTYPFSIQVAAVADAPIPTGLDKPTYLVQVKVGNEIYSSGAFVITVEKSKGLFG